MKEELLSKLQEVVFGLDGNNYREGFSKIKDILGQLRGIMDPATLDEVCEVFGNDYTVKEILSNYFVSGKDSLIASLEDYLSASVTALDGDKTDEADNNSSILEIPNINTENNDMNTEAKIKDVEVTEDGMVKALVELPAQEAAKVLTVIDKDKEMGSDVAKELVKLIVDGDPEAAVPESIKPVSGKIVEIIDTKDTIDPNNFSVSQIRTYNKYMYQFSDAVNEDVGEEALAAACAGCVEQPGVEEELDAPDQIPVKSTVVETNSALPGVEDVHDATQPIAYVDSEMVAAGENDTVDALNEITDALGSMEAEPAAEALALVAENTGVPTAEALQGEVLSKANPEFKSFSRNSWMTDREIFAAYSIIAQYVKGQVSNFSTSSGSQLKEYFYTNFAKAVEIVNGKNANFGTATRKLANNFLETAAERIKFANKVLPGLTGEAGKAIQKLELMMAHRDDVLKEIQRIERLTEDAVVKEFGDSVGRNEALNKLRSQLNTLDRSIAALSDEVGKAGSYAANSIAPSTEAAKVTVGDFLKQHYGKVGLAGGATAGAGALGGYTLSESQKAVPGLSDEDVGFSESGEEDPLADVSIEDHSDVMDKVVEVVADSGSLEHASELLAEVAEKVSPEVALAIQAEICKEDSKAAKEIADNAIVDEDEVSEALDVIASAIENPEKGENFSESKAKAYWAIMGNFSDAIKEMLEDDEDDDEEDEDEDEDSLAEDEELVDSDPRMDAIVEKFGELPSVKDAAVLLSEIEEKTGPEVGLAVQSELLKNNSDLFKQVNEEFAMDDDTVKEVYSIVNGFNPEVSFSNFSESRKVMLSKYLRNFAAAMTDEDKKQIVEEVKQEIMQEMAAPAPDAGAPVPPVGPEGVPPMPPVDPAAVPPMDPAAMPVDSSAVPPMPVPPPAPMDGAPMVPPPPQMPVDMPMAPGAVPAPAPVPEQIPVPPAAPVPPVPAPDAPVMPPPGMMAAPQVPVSVEQPGTEIPSAPLPGPIDPSGVMRPDINPVVPALTSAPAPIPPHPYVGNGEEGVAEVPALPMEMPTEAVATSTTGDFVPGAVNAPKYVHLIQQSPIEQMQATMPPVEPAVGNPQMPPMDQLSDIEKQKAIADNFSRVRKPMNFSSSKQSQIEQYRRTMLGL